jgi:hypothetical protein
MNSPQINADERRSAEDYVHEALTEKIIGVFYDLYNELGHGFLESVYHKAMFVALTQAGLSVESKPKIPVFFRGHLVGDFEADVVVEGKGPPGVEGGPRTRPRSRGPDAELPPRNPDRDRVADELRFQA